MKQKIKLQTKDWKNGYDVGFQAGKDYLKNLISNGDKHGWICKCGANNSRTFLRCPKCKSFRK